MLIAIILAAATIVYILYFGIDSRVGLTLLLLSLYSHWVQRNFKLKSIEYDQESIYISDGKQDVQIFMVDIKSIELDNVAGNFRINFFRETPFGLDVYFKPSVFYPLNFNKMDTKVNRLRFLIDRAKRQQLPPNQASQLASYNSKS